MESVAEEKLASKARIEVIGTIEGTMSCAGDGGRVIRTVEEPGIRQAVKTVLCCVPPLSEWVGIMKLFGSGCMEANLA